MCELSDQQQSIKADFSWGKRYNYQTDINTRRSCPQVTLTLNIVVPEGVKWELGLAGFAMGKWGSSHWDWDLVTGTGKKMLKIKNGNGIWELQSRIWKKMNWEMGLVPLPPPSFFRTLVIAFGYVLNILLNLVITRSNALRQYLLKGFYTITRSKLIYLLNSN